MQSDVVSFEEGQRTWRWRSPGLGQPRAVELPQGTIEVFERGRGPSIVFAHGWLANANLWRKVVEPLAERFHCVVADLPLGSHRVPLRPEADLTPQGCGQLIAGLIDALDLSDVTLVGCDSGGAYSQIAVAARPERVARLLLTSCETLYDSFPPQPFASLPVVAQNEAALGELLEALRDRAVRATPPAYGLLVKHPIEPLASDSYALPSLYDRGVLHDVSKAMAHASTEAVHEAARRLIGDFARPVGFVWSEEDPVFPIEHARRYAAQLAAGRLEVIEDAYSFTPEDQPEALARAIAGFVSPN
jgi:pimeloyl-ACP methyl ester carboxylesterase